MGATHYGGNHRPPFVIRHSSFVIPPEVSVSAPFPQLPPANVPAIYVGTPQGQFGPMTLDALLQGVSSGQLPADAAVWYEGLANWVRLGDHPELRDRLARSQAPAMAAPRPAAVAAPAGPQRSDDEMDRLFGNLVKASWDYYNQNQFAHQVDEVFIGAVITSTLDNGYALIDLNSDGNNHYLRFQNMQDNTRIVYQLHTLAHSPAEAKVLGHYASVTVGYGARVGNLDRIWNALKAEFKSGFIQSPEPGTVTIDADVGSGYIYAQVDMFWNIGDYVNHDYATDYPKLSEHVGVSVHALRKYLHGRIQ